MFYAQQVQQQKMRQKKAANAEKWRSVGVALVCIFITSTLVTLPQFFELPPLVKLWLPAIWTVFGVVGAVQALKAIIGGSFGSIVIGFPLLILCGYTVFTGSTKAYVNFSVNYENVTLAEQLKEVLEKGSDVTGEDMNRFIEARIDSLKRKEKLLTGKEALLEKCERIYVERMSVDAIPYNTLRDEAGDMGFEPEQITGISSIAMRGKLVDKLIKHNLKLKKTHEQFLPVMRKQLIRSNFSEDEIKKAMEKFSSDEIVKVDRGMLKLDYQILQSIRKMLKVLQQYWSRCVVKDNQFYFKNKDALKLFNQSAERSQELVYKQKRLRRRYRTLLKDKLGGGDLKAD